VVRGPSEKELLEYMCDNKKYLVPLSYEGHFKAVHDPIVYTLDEIAQRFPADIPDLISVLPNQYGFEGDYLLQRAHRLPKILVCSTAQNNQEAPQELFLLPASKAVTDATFRVMGLMSARDSDVYSDIQDLIQEKGHNYEYPRIITNTSTKGTTMFNTGLSAF